ncbi:hypothetical protein JNUCC0626_06640 [Lentzea sp. JNUCC 0626]|uniref:hypothetical protein n=1 Tax=Lentzea sp. JNUCC 0626 TaxID=3367513 RepID=UPI0037495699
MIDDADLLRFRARIADTTQHGTRSFAALREHAAVLAGQAQAAERRGEQLRAAAPPVPKAPPARRPAEDDGYEVRLEDSW